MKVIIGIFAYLIICFILSGGNTDVAVTLFWGIPVVALIGWILYGISKKLLQITNNKNKIEFQTYSAKHSRRETSKEQRRYNPEITKIRPDKTAKIEFETYTIGENRNSKYISEKIPTLFLPVRKINQMRKLETNYHQNNSNFYFTSDDKIFINQAKFMVDFNDNYDSVIDFMHYRPVYRYMSNDQLRVYFTWRSNVKKSIVKNISLSYFYVYVYELINNVHAGTCEDTIKQLVYVWKEFRKFDDSVDRYLVEWVKDYYIVNDFKCSFKDIVERLDVAKFYPLAIKKVDITDIPFESISRYSKYKYQKSKFLDNETTQLLIKCFYASISELDVLFDSYNFRMIDLLLGEVCKDDYWKPFNGAVYNEVALGNKKIYISEREHYEIINDKITRYSPILDTTVTSLFIGFIFKYIEARIRILYGYKNNLYPNRAKLIEEIFFRNSYTAPALRVAVSDALFIDILDWKIEDEYNKFHNIESNNEKYERVSDSLRLPIKEFKQMRKITHSTGRNYAPARDFYMQAIQMKNFEYINTNKPEAEERILVTKPVMYSNMTNNQLADYFQWRALYKKGDIIPTNTNNIELYISELINNVHDISVSAVLVELSRLLKNYKNNFSISNNIIVKAIKDYYICNNVSMQFESLIQHLGIDNYYPDILLANRTSKKWHLVYFEYSQYKIINSKFYDNKTKNMIEECFDNLIKHLSNYFKEFQIDLYSLLFGRGKKNEIWHPFEGLIYYSKSSGNKSNSFRRKISNFEVYEYKKRELVCF